MIFSTEISSVRFNENGGYRTITAIFKTCKSVLPLSASGRASTKVPPAAKLPSCRKPSACQSRGHKRRRNTESGHSHPAMP
jgi:hypothetical protein